MFGSHFNSQNTQALGGSSNVTHDASKFVLQQRHLLCYESEPIPETLFLSPNPNPRTHPNPNPIFNHNRNKVFERKQNRDTVTLELPPSASAKYPLALSQLAFYSISTCTTGAKFQ